MIQVTKAYRLWFLKKTLKRLEEASVLVLPGVEQVD